MRGLLDRLPERARVALGAALALPADDFKGLHARLTEALHAVDWPEAPAPIPQPDALDEAQLALATALAEHAGLPVPATFAIPPTTWNRRRWLGLEAPSALEREHTFGGDAGPLWQLALARQGDSAAMIDLLRGVPLPDRLEAFRDLCVGAYRCRLTADHDVAIALCSDGFGDDVAEWAPRLADAVREWRRLDPVERGGHRELTRALRFPAFLALARAGVPIEERWETLLPLALGPWRAWTHECVEAVAPSRRDAAIEKVLADALDGAEVVELGLDLIASVHRSPWLVGRVLEHAAEHDRKTEGEVLAELRAAVEGDAELESLVQARQSERSAPLDLRVRRVIEVATVEDVPPYLRSQMDAIPEAAGWLDPDARLRIVELAEHGSARTFTAYLHHVDEGLVFRRRTTEIVARVCQFHVDAADPALGEGLKAALREALGRGP